MDERIIVVVGRDDPIGWNSEARGDIQGLGSTGDGPAGTEWMFDGVIFQARLPKSVTAAQAAQLAAYVLRVPLNTDGDLVISENGKYFTSV